jgi:hypothetical protein
MAIDWTRTSPSNARESRRAPMMEGKDSLEREVLAVSCEALLWTCPVENGAMPDAGRTRDDMGSHFSHHTSHTRRSTFGSTVAKADNDSTQRHIVI